MRTIILSGLLALVCFMISPQILSAQQTELTQARLLGTTKAVRDLPLFHANITANRTKSKAKKQFAIPNFNSNIPMPTPFKNIAEPQNGDPLYQLHLLKDLTTIQEPNLVFDGMDQADSGTFPPDTNGDVSDEFYVQTVNSTSGALMSVWDKEGNLVQAPVALNGLWADFNIEGLGDPIVLWDKNAQRWLISELGAFGTDIMLIAISETADPTGNWMAYEIQSPELPDYPKYGIWNDSYFITTNEVSGDFIPVYVINRTAMLNGDEFATVIRLEDMTKFGSDNNIFQVATPVNHVGTIPPPAGSPHYSVRIHDDAWDGGEDAIEVWTSHVDWANPGDAIIEGPTFIPIASFDSELCDNNIFDCVSQGDGTTISVLQQVIMYRANYRNFGSHESIVFNFSVDVDGTNHAGARWVELRKQGEDDWSLYQEGTIAPDENHRFMGSINIDASGNILLAYTVTGPTAELDLRYTGRRNGDPLGEMTIDEFEFADGTGISTIGRWGDYSTMSIDPSNDLTFWFTGEYYGGDTWKTSIMSTTLRKDTFDIGIQSLENPTNSGYLTDAEPVTIIVHNYGYEAAHGFDLSYAMDGGAAITEAFPDTIQPDSSRFYTFSSTEDLSIIGDYDFIVYSSWVRDTAFYNDTIKTTVKQLTRNDAQIQEIDGTGGFACTNIFEGGIILKNEGVDTLTSATIEYQINDNTPAIIDWTGSLAYRETETILVMSSDVLDGLNTISANVSLPNGNIDENMNNDSIVREFTLLIENSVELELILLTDDYPNETAWDLKDLEGNILFRENDFSEQQTEHIERWCLPVGCYNFTLYDSYGDGLQYQGVEGDAIIRRINDDIILFNLGNPNFGTDLTVQICSDFECSLTAETMVENISEAGASDGSIILSPINSAAPLEYSIDNGTTWQSSAVFNNLEAGMHTILIRDGSNCETSVETEVGTCTLMISAEAIAASTNGSDDGMIVITATGGGDSVLYSIDGENFTESNTFENLPSGDYQVLVQNADGCLQVLEIMVDALVATQTLHFGASATILPNPTNGVFMVEVRGLNDLSTLKIDIIDTNGRLLKTDRLVNYSGVLKNRLSLVTYPSGIYYLRIRDARFNQVLRVVKE